MNILILGDVCGSAGVKAVTERLPNLISQKKIDFTILNGENAAEKNTEDFFKAGADVITTGNHVWDQKEIIEFIETEKRLLRPDNLTKGSPGKGYGIFQSKNNKKVAVINLMGNVFMRKCEDAFKAAKKFIETLRLKKEADFILVSIPPIADEDIVIKNFGEIIICGRISQMNATTPGSGIKNLAHVLVKRLTIRGFLIFDHQNEIEPFETDMSNWLLEGKIKFKETIFEGIENAPKSFIALLNGKNIGKMLVKI